MTSHWHHFRVWRGDAESGDLVDYPVEVNEGEVVLDIIHRLQQTEAQDLAVRWNCKAGKCGSCSAEINGRPRLMCMTRMSTFADDEVITVTPLRTFPVIRDLVTDVGFNYTKAREVPSFAPPADLAPGEYRMQQVDVERSQEFRKCIECYLCQNTCHVVRDHEENKPAFAGPRYLMRVAELEMHPLDVADRRETAQDDHGLGLLQHHQVLHRGLPGAHQDHRQRAHPAEGARGRPQVRPTRLAGQQDLPPDGGVGRASARSVGRAVRARPTCANARTGGRFARPGHAGVTWFPSARRRTERAPRGAVTRPADHPAQYPPVKRSVTPGCTVGNARTRTSPDGLPGGGMLVCGCLLRTQQCVELVCSELVVLCQF